MAEVSNPARQVSQNARPSTINGFPTGRAAVTTAGTTKSANRYTSLAMDVSQIQMRSAR